MLRKYQTLHEVKQAIVNTIEEKSHRIVIKDEAFHLVDDICLALKRDDAKFTEEAEAKRETTKTWLVSASEEHGEWKAIESVFRDISSHKKSIIVNASGTLSKRHVPGLLAAVPGQMQTAARLIRLMEVNQNNILDAMVLVYLLLAQRKKAQEEDKDPALKNKTDAINKYSRKNREQAFEPIYQALSELVNHTPLLRSRIPYGLVAPSEEVLKAQVAEQEQKQKIKSELTEPVEAKLHREIEQIATELKQAKDNIENIDNELKSIQQKSLSKQISPNFSDEEIQAFGSIEHCNGVIPFSKALAEKCQLTQDEIESWQISDDAQYGGRYDTLAQMRYWASGSVGQYMKSYLGSSIVPTIPAAVIMQKLKAVYDASKMREEIVKKVEHKLALQSEVDVNKRSLDEKQTQKHILEENKQIEQARQQIASVMNRVKLLPENPQEKIQCLLMAKKALADLDITDSKQLDISVHRQRLDDQIGQTLEDIAIAPTLQPNSETRYHHLNYARTVLQQLRPNFVGGHYDFQVGQKIARYTRNLSTLIQQARIEKTWDTTFEVYQYGEQREKWWHYFLGVPKNRGRSGILLVLESFEWMRYLFFGCLLIPAKNFLKLFTEFFAKRLDALCENVMENTESQAKYRLAVAGHYFFKTWWVCLRTITSPIVSVKAAWQTIMGTSPLTMPVMLKNPEKVLDDKRTGLPFGTHAAIGAGLPSAVENSKPVQEVAANSPSLAPIFSPPRVIEEKNEADDRNKIRIHLAPNRNDH